MGIQSQMDDMAEAGLDSEELKDCEHGRWLNCGFCRYGVEPEAELGTSIDQPPPVTNENEAVWPKVIADFRAQYENETGVADDMQERHEAGIRKYGTALQPFNGRDAILDAYGEALDLVVYVKQKLHELYGEGKTPEESRKRKELGLQLAWVYQDALAMAQSLKALHLLDKTGKEVL